MAFDLSDFKHQINTEKLDRDFPVVDEGDYDNAFIRSIELKKRLDSGALVTEVWWDIRNPTLKQELNISDDRWPTVKQTLFLNLTEMNTLDPSNNQRLERVCEAVGVDSGDNFSLASLEGCGPAIVHVAQEVSEKDPETIYCNVTRVAESDPNAIAEAS